MRVMSVRRTGLARFERPGLGAFDVPEPGDEAPLAAGQQVGHVRSGLVDEQVVAGVLPAAEGERWHDETVSPIQYSMPLRAGPSVVDVTHEGHPLAGEERLVAYPPASRWLRGHGGIVFRSARGRASADASCVGAPSPPGERAGGAGGRLRARGSSVFWPSLSVRRDRQSPVHACIRRARHTDGARPTRSRGQGRVRGVVRSTRSGRRQAVRSLASTEAKAMTGAQAARKPSRR